MKKIIFGLLMVITVQANASQEVFRARMQLDIGGTKQLFTWKAHDPMEIYTIEMVYDSESGLIQSGKFNNNFSFDGILWNGSMKDTDVILSRTSLPDDSKRMSVIDRVESKNKGLRKSCLGSRLLKLPKSVTELTPYIRLSKSDFCRVFSLKNHICKSIINFPTEGYYTLGSAIQLVTSNGTTIDFSTQLFDVENQKVCNW